MAWPFSSGDDCDTDCLPSYMQKQLTLSPAVLISWFPLILSFFLVFVITIRYLVPLLSMQSSGQDGADFSLGSIVTGLRKASSSAGVIPRGGVQRVAILTVGTTCGLIVVLGELVLSEIIGLLHTAARQSALRVTIGLLLVLLLLIIPSLEIYSLVSSRYSYVNAARRPAFGFAWVLHISAHLVFLVTFWYVGYFMLLQHDLKTSAPKSTASSRGPAKAAYSFSLLDTTTSYIGVIGISLMALLSGFASISSPWQNFFARPAPVSEPTVSRKKAGLDSAREMLATKKSRLRALEQKISNMSQSASQPSLLEKAASTFRGNPDNTERANLKMEISGLEDMILGLASTHSVIATRYSLQQRSKTPLGRMLSAAEQVFAIYCLYRIVTTVLSFLRRKTIGPAPMAGVETLSTLHPGEQPSTFDPLMTVLSLIAPSSLDAAALSRQITFLLSGLMLLASFSSVLQTFHMLARFAPWVLRAVHKNLPLIVSQVCGTYVIAVALLLRGRLGGKTDGATLTGLGGGELGWVDGWFEGWFLLGAFVTAAGIWFGRKVLAGDEWDDESGDLEAGKRS